MSFSYGATFRIINIGRYNLRFNYQQTEFAVAPNSRETKTVKTIGAKQPASFKLYVRRENEDQRYFVLDILPAEEGSEFHIVIGNDCKYLAFLNPLIAEIFTFPTFLNIIPLISSSLPVFRCQFILINQVVH